MTKKLMMLLVALVAALPLMAETETVDGIEWTYRVVDGNAEVGDGDNPAIPTSTSGAITIPSTLGGCPVTSIGEYAFYECSGLTGVTISDRVTSIGEFAFYGCSNLASVVMPLIECDGSVFDGCSPNLVIRYLSYRLTLKASNTKYGTVSGGGIYEAGSTRTIKATAKKDYVFAGWFIDKACKKALNPDGYDNRSPTVKIVMPASDTTIYAKFVTKSADKKSLKFSSATKELAKTPAKATAGAAFSLNLGISSASLPTFAAKGLPKGLSIDKTTGEIKGKAKVPGSYTATVMAKSAAGNVITQKVKINVSVPAWAKGTFYGTAQVGCCYCGDPPLYLKFSVGVAGKVSGKVIAADGKAYSFVSAYKSCTAERSTFTLKAKIGKITFKPGKVTVAKKNIGNFVVVEASSADKRTVAAQKKPNLVKKGKAFAKLVGKTFTFAGKNDKLIVKLVNGDVVKFSYVVGGRTVTARSWVLTLSNALENGYRLYVDIIDSKIDDGFNHTVILLVSVDESGKVTDVTAEGR